MLKQLCIQSLGLVESSQLDFHEGFTSITGETGSGKTSLVEALKLTLGKKSDFEFIKKGAKKAEIRAVFDLNKDHPVFESLKELGFTALAEEPLILSRILSVEGKSKAFINEQAASLYALQTIAPSLCLFVDQNDLLKLHDEFYYHHLIDAYGELKTELSEYQKSYELYLNLKKKIQDLKKQTHNKEIKQAVLSEEISELEGAKIKPGEEQSLFEEYKILQKKREGLESAHLGSHLLGQDILPKIKKLKAEKHLSEEEKTSLETAYLSLCDASESFESKLESQAYDEQLLQKHELRLKLIYSLKRKYNQEIEAFESLLLEKSKELDTLIMLDETIEKTELMLQEAQSHLEKVAQDLKSKRQLKALELAEKVAVQLQELNMPFAELEFTFTDSNYSIYGSTDIDLLIKTNVSSPKVSLIEGASGGELARVNFCLFLETSRLNHASTYIFDEIDAHVGGVTSSLMGEKLQKLAQSKQVFCITHFPQMALKGHNHLAFIKNQHEDKTTIEIHYTENNHLRFEIDRMVGVKG
jgi:DNA repair protein RecN (Recombination protein N)